VAPQTTPLERLDARDHQAVMFDWNAGETEPLGDVPAELLQMIAG
jgi:hypothetical protein